MHLIYTIYIYNKGDVPRKTITFYNFQEREREREYNRMCM